MSNLMNCKKSSLRKKEPIPKHKTLKQIKQVGPCYKE